MMIALTYEESEKVPKLIEELISIEDKLNECTKKELEERAAKKAAIDTDPLMQQPIIREYVYAMLRQHKYKKDIDDLQEKINETYNIEKNYQKSIIVGDFYYDEQ